MEALLSSSIDFAMFFYNPNIYPEEEYLLRKQSAIRFAEKHGVQFIDADYEPADWFARTRGMELDPERGRRCNTCFDLRLERTARHAVGHAYDVIATSLGMSRQKRLAEVNASGRRAVAPYPQLAYWDNNWRKGGGITRALEICRREDFYRQTYCGCQYSMPNGAP